MGYYSDVAIAMKKKDYDVLAVSAEALPWLIGELPLF